MDQNKEINKLLRKAELIHNEDIEDFENTKFIDIPFEDFLAVTGDLFFHEEQDAFYKNKGDLWYRFKHRREAPMEMKGLDSSQARIVWDPAIMDRILRLEAWAKDMKRYVDESFNYYETRIQGIEKVQSEAIKELQEYTNLKIKELEEKWKKDSKKSKKLKKKSAS